MKIFFQCKRPGVKHTSIEPLFLDVKEETVKVGTLITSIVEQIVEEYNQKSKNKPDSSSIQITPRGELEIQDLATTGKIAFGLIYNDNNVTPERAIKTALSGYEDGLFKIFLNQELLGDLDSETSITDGDLLTVVRLTFLSGRII